MYISITLDGEFKRKAFFVLQHAAELEKAQNEKDSKKKTGSSLSYGNIVQV